MSLIGGIALGTGLTSIGCFGGQTGTEFMPGTGGTTSLTGTDSTEGNGQDGGKDVSTPATAEPGGVCQGGATSAPDIDAATGMTTGNVVDFVQALSPLLVQYGSGNETYVDVTVAPQSGACAATSSNGPATLSVPVTIRLLAADGHFDLGLSGVVTASAGASGEVGEVDIAATRACGAAPGWLEPSSCDVVGIDLSGFERTSIELSARAQSFGQATQLLGSMRISGVLLGQCSGAICSAKDWTVVTSFLVSNTGDSQLVR